jgi:serine/threonine-protein kinase
MMLTTDGAIKLMDFGIARQRDDQTLTVAGTTTGSLSYMSPEQVNGEKTDARSDLYSMGISLYELVTGQRPFRADSDFAVMVAHLKEMPRPPIELKPELGAPLNEIILKSIAKNPADRYQSADEFRAALVSISAPSTVGYGTGALVPPPFGGNTATRVAPEPAPTIIDPPTVPVPTRVTTVPPPVPMPQPVAVVPPVPAMPPPVVRSGHPAMYVVLGGVLVIAALVGAGLYIGRAEAEPGKAATTTSPASAPTPPAPSPTPAPTPTPAPATPPVSPEPTPAPVTATAAPPPPGAPGPSPAAKTGTDVAVAPTTAPGGTVPAAMPGNALAAPGATTKPAAMTKSAAAAMKTPPAAAKKVTSSGTAPAAVAEPAQPTSAPGVDFDELEAEVDQLVTRAAAINSSLDSMRHEQQRMGLNLRGDIASRQEAMNQNVTRARDAIKEGNAARLQRFKALATGDVEALERFLGR